MTVPAVWCEECEMPLRHCPCFRDDDRPKEEPLYGWDEDDDEDD